MDRQVSVFRLTDADVAFLSHPSLNSFQLRSSLGWRVPTTIRLPPKTNDLPVPNTRRVAIELEIHATHRRSTFDSFSLPAALFLANP